MGEVWLAWDLNLNRNVALKILRTAETPSPEALKRFEREAHAAGQLRGQHSVRIFDYGASDDGLYYIAMEYLPGMDLGTMVERFGPLPRARAVRAVMQACLALEEAHAAGIIHRDIKPHNLFMTRVGDDADFIKLLDFGIVRLRMPEPTTGELTWTGIVVGTPAFMAPELLEGAPADERSDLYALGVTLHVLVTGKSPFDIGGNRMPSDADLRVMYAPEHPGADANDPLADLLHRCLARDPSDRIQSARELREALASLPDLTWSRRDANEFWQTAERRAFA
jgi:serine/threonine-protein kinase